MSRKQVESWKVNGAGVYRSGWRAAVGVLFLYLVLTAHQLLGVAGVVVTSIFFILATFSPLLVHLYNRIRKIVRSRGHEHIPYDHAAKRIVGVEAD